MAAVLLVCAPGRPVLAGLVLSGWYLDATAAVTQNASLPPNFPTGFEHMQVIRPAIETAIASRGIADNGVPIRASAYQHAGGWNGATAEAGNGQFERNGGDAEAYLEMEIVNTGDQPLPLKFGLLINQARLKLELANFVALGEKRPYAAIGAQVFTGVGSKAYMHYNWEGRLAAPNSDGPAGYREDVNFIDRQQQGKPTYRSEFQPASYQYDLEGNVIGFVPASTTVIFSPFIGKLDLDMLAPGKSLTVTYKIWASVDTGRHDPNRAIAGMPPYERALALIEDPFGLEVGAITINDQPVSAFIPEPSSSFLCAAALVMLIARTRRRVAVDARHAPAPAQY